MNVGIAKERKRRYLSEDVLHLPFFFNRVKKNEEQSKEFRVL